MSHRRTPLLMALFCLRAWGQTASVDGVVVNSLTGAHLARVQVTLKDPAVNPAGLQYGARTTEDGRFSISGIKPGSYSVTAEHVGFSAPRSASGHIVVALKAGDETGDVRVNLDPAGAITGRITDAHGDPLEHAEVTVEGVTNKEATTDDKGQFRIGGEISRQSFPSVPNVWRALRAS